MTVYTYHRGTIHFSEEGSRHRGAGTSFLLLHGLGGSRQQWGQVQRALATTSHSIAVDIVGFGESRGRRFHVDAASEELAFFCEAYELERCVLVSHSIGSTVAGLLAARAAPHFTRLILTSGTLFRAARIAQHPGVGVRAPRLGLAVTAQFLTGMVPMPDSLRRLVAHNAMLRTLSLWPFVAHPGRLDPVQLDAALEGAGSCAVLRILLDARMIDYPRIMSSVPQPVDLIWGAKDRLITRSDIDEMRRTANVVREHEIADCGHWPMIEKPTELTALIRIWGRDEEPGDRQGL
ncbi:alpha/beta fold hydrolase [Phytohabitans houttuyneae]|uniref:Hydrolase n=1 Tax=Phytohabitans houttuyneae TaxID=1076126 RepID=A0A6V8KWP7_9ACTN|nr:alpha/beta hydrolase [Phytohabitans houttuyneae]GFJ86257.1 hydrolase [Phytohabitans houttuyneae]